MTRRAWILGSDPWKAVQLGPLERLRSLCELAMAAGHEVHLVTPSGTCSPPATYHPQPLDLLVLQEIRPGDIVVASAFLPPKILWNLIRSDIPFHVDFYCVGAPEGLASRHMNSTWRNRLGRRRTAMRYRILLDRAERLYFSNQAQMMFFAGTCYCDADEYTAARLDRLPERSVFAPMGVRTDLFPTNMANPYPPELKDRPIFLWGGGIWEWFDMSTLLEAFAILKKQASPAVLFFLVGNNPSGSTNQDQAPSSARTQAERLGLLGHNVFFNNRSVPPTELPGYLHHCYAGILSNAANLEAAAAWRTRYLDLLWAEKPLVVNRHDILASIIESKHAAHISNSGTPEALAEVVHNLASNPTQYQSMQFACREAFTQLSSSILFEKTVSAWHHDGFQEIGRKASYIQYFKWAIGY